MTTETLYVIHPLDAAPEQKCSTEGLGPMELTRPVRASACDCRRNQHSGQIVR